MFGKAIAFLQIPFGLGKSLPSFFVVCGFRTGLVSPLVNQNWQEFVPFFCFPSLGFKVIWFPTVFPPNPSIDAFFLVFLHDHTNYSFKRKTIPKTSAENLRSAGYHQDTLLQQGSHGLLAETWERRERWDFDPSDSLVGVSDLPAPATSETTWDRRIFGSSWLKIFWRPSGRAEQFESNCHWNWFTSVFGGYFSEGRTIEKKTFQWPKRSLMNESSHLGSAKNLGGWTGWTSSSTSRF